MKKTKLFLVAALITAFVSTNVTYAFQIVQTFPAMYENRVNLFNDDQIILINDKEHTIPATVYYSEPAGSLMVPIRYICIALGLPEGAVKWDSANSSITIDAGRRIIWMQIGASHYYLNGTLTPILSDGGDIGIVEIKENRAYVPYNTIAEALHISVELTKDGSGIIYNAPKIK